MMITKRISAILLTVSFFSLSAHAATFTGEVRGLVPPDSRPCMFFSIAGVNEADPIKPGWPWIAVPTGTSLFKDLYAFVLAAKHTGTPVTVITSGAGVSACDGYVGLRSIYHAP